VHAARKRVKKVRSVLTLLQHFDADAFDKDARRLRAAGRLLAVLRDADAVIATYDRLRKRFRKRLPEHTYAMMRRPLVKAKSRAMRDARADGQVVPVAGTLRAVRRRVKRWRVPAIDLAKWPDLLTPSYRASRKAMRRAQTSPSPSELHRWRRRVKTFWYQLRLGESLAPGVRGEIGRFRQLQQSLGEHHDLDVLQKAVAGDAGLHRMPAAVDELTAMSRAVQAELQRKAFTLGERLLAAKPKAFARRLRRAVSPSRKNPVASRRRPSSTVA
jgi:CHAD domain-containing protein